MIKVEGKNLFLFDEFNIIEQGIEQANRSLKEKKDFFSETIKKEKIRIFFMGNTGLHEVETRVWSITEKAIIIKHSTVIPLANIIAVA